MFASVAVAREQGDATPAGEPLFEQTELEFAIAQPTSLAFGPDGRLYVSSQTEIWALTLDAEGDTVLASEQIASDLQGVLGIAFDPTEPAPVAVYASRQEPSAIDGFEGAVSKFTAPDWQRTDVISGLPTSAPRLNHLTNGLAFDEAGRLFIAQGSATDTGITNPPGALYWPETPLSAAILVADIHAPGFNGAITYHPPAPPADDNVDLVSGDVQVYASGVRNPYDLVLHSNGHMYATDNGPTGAPTSLSCETEGGATNPADELNLIEEGNYYGAPNRNRGRFDPRQCVYRDPALPSGPDFTSPIALLPAHCSCDGIAEYASDAFGGAMRGDLIYAGFQNRRVYRAELAPDGRSAPTRSVLSSDFSGPLDVAVAANGTIYVADFVAGAIALLEPASPATETPAPMATPTPTGTATATPPGATPEATASPTQTPAAPPSPTPSRTPTPAGLVGDVDCSGSVTSIDAALVLQLVAGLLDALTCQGGADANADGNINAIDAQLILQLTAGLLERLPP
jgi:glucose/arabinose dehydrogenase